METKERGDETRKILKDLTHRVDELCGVVKEPSSHLHEKRRKKVVVKLLCQSVVVDSLLTCYLKTFWKCTWKESRINKYKDAI